MPQDLIPASVHNINNGPSKRSWNGRKEYNKDIDMNHFDLSRFTPQRTCFKGVNCVVIYDVSESEDTVM